MGGERRKDLAIQTGFDGGEILLGEINQKDERLRRVAEMVEYGVGFAEADILVQEAMAVERLSAAFGGLIVEKVDPDSLGLPN